MVFINSRIKQHQWMNSMSLYIRINYTIYNYIQYFYTLRAQASRAFQTFRPLYPIISPWVEKKSSIYHIIIGRFIAHQFLHFSILNKEWMYIPKKCGSTLNIQILFSIKVVATYYPKLRNDFKLFPANNQASDWMTQHV